MKRVFALTVAIGFLWGTFAFASDEVSPSYTINFSKAYGIAVENKPDQHRVNTISVEIIDVNGTETTVFYDVIFKWDAHQYALIPIEIIEVIKPVIPKECDHQFYRIFHQKECAGWVDPGGSGGGGGGLGQGCGTEWKPGDWNYCRNCGPCGEGQGGCLKSSGCAKGLVCDKTTHRCVKPK